MVIKGSKRRGTPDCRVCACGAHAWGRTNRWGVILVDICDQALLALHVWTLDDKDTGGRLRRAYAVRTDRGNKRTTLHGSIMPSPAGKMVDHASCNGLDNRRSNLRVTTSQGNCANARKMPGMTSRFKGVRWHKNKKWTAQIKIQYRQIYLGSFNDEEDAARAYDAAALAEWGAMARINFPFDGCEVRRLGGRWGRAVLMARAPRKEEV